MDDMFVPPKKKSGPRFGAVEAAPVTEQEVSDPPFSPPEQIAESEELQDMTSVNTLQTNPPKPPKKASWWRRLSRKKKIIILIATVFVLLAGSAAAYVLTRKDKPAPVVAAPVELKAEEPAKPTTEASKLTGVQIDPELNKRGVTAIMIENSVDARPQSGLLDAGVVYEAIAEGGITRFLALFQEGQPTYIGPVRSARPYYIDWLMPYGATYAHVGGSTEALQMISDLKIKDMNEFAYASAYQRVSNRYAPHNAYTNMANLDAIRSKNSWGNPDFTGLTRKADAPSKAPTATSINVAISSVTFNSHYDYDTTTNSYKRSEGGLPHTDEKSGKQLQPKVVITLVVPYSIHPDGIHSKYQTVGSGQAYVFQDGIMQEATWTKSSQAAQIEFKDAGGRALTFNAGQTWVTAVDRASMVTYTGPPAPAGAPQ